MDQIIEKKQQPWKKYAAIGAAALFGMVIVNKLLNPATGETLNIAQQQLIVSPVIEGTFENSINLRANVEPLDTLYVDAIEGGQVEAIYVEDGQLLEKGQLILELSNPAVQISVIRSDADTTQQLNNIRSLELQLEQNRLRHKSNLVDINYNIARLETQLKRLEPLASQNVASASELEDLKIEYDWYINRREITIESQRTDMLMQEQQMQQLKKAAEQLTVNLEMARKNLENLIVRAPKAGRLTDFDVKVGESVGVGVRIGQIDEPEKYKLSADVGEFYIDQVSLNQRVNVKVQGKDYQLKISKIYPQVVNNKFKVDMVFDGEVPSDIRRGQTLSTSLQLGDAKAALMVENGAFYQDTGGNWVFVVSNDGTSAAKRQVQLGQRNSRYIEVISGLQKGDQVVTSSYGGYINKDRLDIKAN